MLSRVTMGAAASKKCRSLPGHRAAMEALRTSLVRGPEATITSPGGISRTSPGTTVICSQAEIRSVTARA